SGVGWAGRGRGGAAPGAARVFVQRVDPGGLALPDDFALETPLASTVADPAIANLGSGTLLVAWEQDRRILAQRITPDGRALQVPFAISGSGDATTEHGSPAVAVTPEGDAIVVWRDTHPSADGSTPATDV